MQLRKDMLTIGDLIAACQTDAERRKLQLELSAKWLRYQSLMSDRGWTQSEAFTDYQREIQQRLTENG